MFEVPESDIKCVKIDEEVVLGKKPIEYIRKTSQQASSPNDQQNDKNRSESSGDSLNSEEKSKAKTYA